MGNQKRMELEDSYKFLVRQMSLPSTLPLTRHRLFVDGKKRLPSRKEWIDAAYTENRENPTDGFQKGKPIVSQPENPQKAQIASRNAKLKLSLLQQKELQY